MPEHAGTYVVVLAADDAKDIPRNTDAVDLIAAQMSGELNEETGLFCAAVEQVDHSNTINLTSDALAEWFEGAVNPDGSPQHGVVHYGDKDRELIKFLHYDATEEDRRIIGNIVMSSPDVWAALEAAIFEAIDIHKFDKEFGPTAE